MFQWCKCIELKHVPLIEDDPRLVEDARKPIYALLEFVCEKLGLIFLKNGDYPLASFDSGGLLDVKLVVGTYEK